MQIFAWDSGFDAYCKSTASSCTAGLTSPLNLPLDPSLNRPPLIPNKYGADKQRRVWHIETGLGPIQQLLIVRNAAQENVLNARRGICLFHVVVNQT